MRGTFHGGGLLGASTSPGEVLTGGTFPGGDPREGLSPGEVLTGATFHGAPPWRALFLEGCWEASFPGREAGLLRDGLTE